VKPEKESDSALGEFRQFVGFLGSLWTILAGVSVFFPLSNELAQVIPLSPWPEGGLMHLSPSVVTGITTLSALFLVLWVFGRRREMSRPSAWRRLPRKAATAFVGGLVSLLSYLLLESLVSHDFYFAVLGWESGDLRCIAGDAVLAVTYGLSFACLTAAFLFLGLREFLRREVK
jgi:hypothetical protein